MAGTREGAQLRAVRDRENRAAERATPDPGTHPLPGHCSACGAPVLLVNLRWVDRDVPMIHGCAKGTLDASL